MQRLVLTLFFALSIAVTYAQDAPVFELLITAIDRDKPIHDVRIVVKLDDETIATCRTDSSGACAFRAVDGARTLQAGNHYTITANKPNFLYLRDQVSTVGITEDTTFIKEYYLQRAGPCFGHDDLLDMDR